MVGHSSKLVNSHVHFWAVDYHFGEGATSGRGEGPAKLVNRTFRPDAVSSRLLAKAFGLVAIVCHSKKPILTESCRGFRINLFSAPPLNGDGKILTANDAGSEPFRRMATRRVRRSCRATGRRRNRLVRPLRVPNEEGRHFLDCGTDLTRKQYL
jgi:hypothetical protein